MILFVFEGDEREPYLYQTLERLYFPKENNNIICSFGNNIYALYGELLDYGDAGDLVSIMREHLMEKGDYTLRNIRSSDISEIFLFFDYDFHNSQLSVEDINNRVEKMLTLFDNETENGKLYINYPMVESICYTKELPDVNYVNYLVSRDDCRFFKSIVHDFSFYSSLDHILFKSGEKPTKERFLMIKDNWQYLKHMNVCKANMLTTGRNAMPTSKSDISQLAIFHKQLSIYASKSNSIAILNSFPIFIFDYFK